MFYFSKSPVSSTQADHSQESNVILWRHHRINWSDSVILRNVINVADWVPGLSIPPVEDVPVSVECVQAGARPGHADCWLESSGKLWDRPGSRAQERARYLDTLGEILCLPLIRTPWAVEVVTRETCDSIRLTLRHQKYLDFNHHWWLFP